MKPHEGLSPVLHGGLAAVLALVLGGCLPLVEPGFPCYSNLPASNPDSVYHVHADGTATDTRTGLQWKRCVEGQSWDGTTCLGKATTHTWQEALQLPEGTSYAGHGDWRLPNLKELRSLVEECRQSPAINQVVFPHVPLGSFWSSSLAGPTYAGHVSFRGGEAWMARRTFRYYVRLVRGGD